MKQINAATKWDRTQPKTVKYLGELATSGYLRDLSIEEFQAFKVAFVGSLEKQLRQLRRRQEMREGPVTPLHIEHKLAHILKLIRPKATAPRNASYIANHFKSGQLPALYALLDDIDEHIPSMNVMKAKLAGYDAVYRHKCASVGLKPEILPKEADL